MPTGPGGLDANGVWQYGEDDTEALASDLLNLGMGSVSTAITNLEPVGVFQLVSTSLLSTYSESLFSGVTSTDVVTGLTATITPISASSKILVRVSVHCANSGQFGEGAFVMRRGSTAIGLPNVSGSRPRLTSQGGAISNAAADLALLSMEFLDTPATTSEIVYGISLHNSDGTTETVFVNRSATNTDGSRFSNPISTITLMEVAS